MYYRGVRYDGMDGTMKIKKSSTCRTNIQTLCKGKERGLELEGAMLSGKCQRVHDPVGGSRPLQSGSYWWCGARVRMSSSGFIAND